MQSIRIAVLALALCFGASLLPVQSHAAAPLPKVKIETSMGDIVVELNPAKAPKTVSNFLYYVKSGFYNNTIFHRVINGFMIQGGGHTADMQEKANSRKPVVNEAGNGLKNDAYTIAMARTNDPDSATAHQCGEQRLPEPQERNAVRLRLCRVRQGHSGAGRRGPHQERIHRQLRPLSGCPENARDHQEHRACPIADFSHAFSAY